jgi:hypothetical protein
MAWSRGHWRALAVLCLGTFAILLDRGDGLPAAAASLRGG